jgi:hypothetical protein
MTKPTEPKLTTKQLKIFLSTNEHAVVATAAKLKAMQIKDYLRLAVITAAKEDSKQFNQVMNNL